MIISHHYSFKDEPEIQAITQLVDAYQDNNIAEFERILAQNREHLTADQFIRVYVVVMIVLANAVRP
jgi:hypothetical protein